MKSRKILIGTMASVLLLLPLYADALGFGNIKVKSALNEPLDAEIELLSATDEEVKDLEIKLASREAFLRAGVDRSQQLTAIKFTVNKHNGKYYVYLKTPQSVREPFMNFLLEMNWKNGRMLREYTVLLDPPNRKATQVAAAPEPTLPSVAEPAPAPVAAVAPAVTPEPATAEVAPAVPLAAEPAPTAPAEPAATPASAAAPEVATAAETPKADKKKSKKKSKKSAQKAAEPAETAIPSAEPAKATEAPPATPAAEVPGGASASAPAQDDGLFPRLPLDENNEVDLKALDESVKQSQAELKAEAVPAEPTAITATEPAKVAPEPEIAPVPTPSTEAAKASESAPSTETAKADESPAPTVATPAPTPKPETPATSGSLDYGITRKGDNLWTVASKLKPSEAVTIYQVMMALQQSNPDAFVKGNIHRLKANHALRIEDPRLLTAMTKEQASKRYEEQTHEWQEYLTSVGVQVPRQAIVAGDAGAKSEETGSVPSGELTLSPPSGEGEGVGSGKSDKLAKKQNTDLLRKQVQKAVADAETERRKNSELASRVEDLEKELKRLENLVTVKDSDLAALQTKLAEVQKQRTAVAETQTKPAEIEAAPAPKPEPIVPVEQPKPAPAPAEIAATPPPQATAPVEAVKPEQPKPVEQAPTEVAPKAAPAVTAVKPVEPKGNGFIANILGMLGGLGMYLMIGGIVLLLLIVLLFIWVRRRNKVYFQESILKGGNATLDSKLNSTTASAPVSSQSSLMTGGESSFLSDFAISGVSAIQAEDSEVDPLTEADVFMAYGRYEAAEERLNEAIKHDPNRGELRVKLLELFSTTKNKKAFETAAEDYYASLGGQTGSNPLWQKVVSMGGDIAPNNPLFKGGGGGGSFTSTANLNDSKVMDIGLNTGAFSKSDFATPSPPSRPAVAKTDDSLDFNLDFGDKTVIPPAKTAKTSGDENTEAGLDFNLDFGGESKPSRASSSPVASGNGGLDFSLDMSADEEPTSTDIKFDNDEEVTGELDFDLESPGPGSAGRAANKAAKEMDLDASDAINLDMPTGGDEVGTKLDLARAYIDMGDPDGARSILDEVMSEGSDGQKQEARQLMSQIG